MYNLQGNNRDVSMPESPEGGKGMKSHAGPKSELCWVMVCIGLIKDDKVFALL